MSTHSHVTLESIAERNAARLQELGVSVDNQTVEAALMQMIAALGELATLSYRHSASLSPFEKEEATLVLGRMTVALSTIGNCLDVDVGAAALCALGGKPSSSDGQGSTATGAAAEPTPRPPNTAAGTPAPQQPTPRGDADVPDGGVHRAPLTLTPTSRDSFFTYLDRLAGDTKEAVEKADLRWVVPNENGALEELVTNGSRAPVPYDLFPLYYRMVQDYRHQHHQHHSGASRSAATARLLMPTQQQPRASIAAQPITTEVPGYNAAREAKMFSPTHFSNGLFSPRADATPSELLHAQVRPPTAVLHRAARPSPAAAYTAHSHEPAQTGPQQAALVCQPMSPEDFDVVVGYLRSGAVSGQQVAQLGLTFCYPQGDRVVELVPDGLQITVTAANCGEFLRLLDEARHSARIPSAERIHRMDSIRRLHTMVAPPATDATGFSPSHFSHNLFAPFEDKSTFYVDYDAADRTLPPYLKLMEQQHQQQQERMRVPPPPPPPSAAAGSQTSGEVHSVYMDAVRSCDYDTLRRLIGEVRATAKAATTYGVTFCVPSALEPNATPTDKARGIYELFPGSSKRVVEPGEQALFLSLVQRYFPGAA